MRFNLTFERLTVLAMFAALLVSKIGWIEIPILVSTALFGLYAFFEWRGMGEMKVTIENLKNSIGGGGVKDPDKETSIGGGGVKDPKG